MNLFFYCTFDVFFRSYRNKTLIFFTLFSLLFFYLIFKVDIAQYASKTKLYWDLLANWVILLGIMMGSDIWKDMKMGVLTNWLSFPISRTQYLLGRVVGIWLVVLGVYCLLILLSYLFSFSPPIELDRFGLLFLWYTISYFFLIVLCAIFSFLLPKFFTLMGIYLLLSLEKSAFLPSWLKVIIPPLGGFSSLGILDISNWAHLLGSGCLWLGLLFYLFYRKDIS